MRESYSLSGHLILLYDGLKTSFDTPEGEHRHPTLLQCLDTVPCTSPSRYAREYRVKTT